MRLFFTDMLLGSRRIRVYVIAFRPPPPYVVLVVIINVDLKYGFQQDIDCGCCSEECLAI